MGRRRLLVLLAGGSLLGVTAAAAEPLPAGAVARLGTTRFRHGDNVSSLGFSADGKTLMTVSPGRPSGVRLWDAADGTPRRQFHATTCALSPDGKTLALGSGGLICLVDPVSGARRQQFSVAHVTELLAWSPDGRTLAAWDTPYVASNGCCSSVISLYDAASGKLLHRLARSHASDSVRFAGFLSFTPDGKSVLSASWDRMLCLWDVRTRPQLPRRRLPAELGHGQEIPPPAEEPRKPTMLQLTDSKQPAHAFALSPDGKSVAAAGDDSRLRVYELASGRVRRTLPLPGFRTRCLAFAPRGDLLAVAGLVQEGRQYFGVVDLWSLASGQRKKRIPFCRAWATSFSPDGRTLATAGWGGCVRLWGVDTGKELRPDGGHRGLVLGLAFSPDGRTLVSEGDDRTVRWWDLKTGKQTRQSDGFCAGLHACTAFSPDGRLLAQMRTDDHSISLREAATGKELRSLRGHKNEIAQMAFSADGKTVVTTERDGPGFIWDVTTGKPLGRFRHAYPSGQTIVLSRDGALLATVGSHQARGLLGTYEIEVRETDRDRPVALLRLAGAPMPGPLVFSADRRTLISGSADGTVHVLELLTKKERLRLRANDWWLSCLAVSPDGRTLATTGSAWPRNQIRLWDLATGKKLGDFPANGYQIYCLAFSPDGKVLASGGADSTILLWDVARLRR